MENIRRLWAAVLLQAYDDLATEDYDSYWWCQAAAFFLSGGDWADSRRVVCDALDLEPDELVRPALRIVNARRLEHGLPVLPPRTATPCPPKQQASEPAAAKAKMPLPRLVALPAPEPPPPAPRRTWPLRSWRDRYPVNPFDPWRKLPSDERKAG